jgi:hypothetical protein
MEEIGRNGAEDDEGQGCNPGLPSDNNQQTTARFQDRGQNGENVRIRQALRADRGGRRTKIHEFFDTRTDENKRHEDTADRQNRIVDASRGTDVRPHWTATHSGCGHRVAPCMNSHENALYDERFLPKPPRPSMTKIPPRINLVGDSNYPAPYCVPAEEIFMRNVGRKLAFVLAASNHGTMITNRFDYRMSGSHAGVGVGFQLLEAGAFDPIEVELALQLIEFRRRWRGGDRLRCQYRHPYDRMGNRNDRVGIVHFGSEVPVFKGLLCLLRLPGLVRGRRLLKIVGAIFFAASSNPDSQYKSKMVPS